MYDLVIVGAGPAGLNASVYASRYGLKNLVIGEITGGLTTQTHEIGNWLGEEKITGFEFAQKATSHVKSLKAEIKSTLVDQIKKNKNGGFNLLLADGSTTQSKTILIATGTKHRKLGVPGEKELLGKGVSYCATCDGFFYKGKTIGIIGGSDSATSAAVYMADIAEKVYLIYRKDKLRAETFWIKNIEKSKNIEVIYNTNVKEIVGDNKIEKVSLDNLYKGKDELDLDGLFIEIGFTPSAALVEDLGVEMDADGYIKVEVDGRTTAQGIWAAGDITTGSNKFKQIVTAAAEGAICANSIQQQLKR